MFTCMLVKEGVMVHVCGISDECMSCANVNMFLSGFTGDTAYV